MIKPEDIKEIFTEMDTLNYLREVCGNNIYWYIKDTKIPLFTIRVRKDIIYSSFNAVKFDENKKICIGHYNADLNNKKEFLEKGKELSIYTKGYDYYYKQIIKKQRMYNLEKDF